MKNIYLLLLLPLIVATTCDKDDINSGFETSFIIENKSSFDLLLLNDDQKFIEIKSQFNVTIGSELNSETNPIPPSKTHLFSAIKLYTLNNNNYIRVYTQDPINDELWIFSEPLINQFKYKLLITDELID